MRKHYIQMKRSLEIKLKEDLIYFQDYLRVHRDKPTFLKASNGNDMVFVPIVDFYYDFEILEHCKSDNLELVKVSDLIWELDIVIRHINV